MNDKITLLLIIALFIAVPVTLALTLPYIALIPLILGIGLAVSRGNSKLGKIPNWSLPPGKTCGNVPCKKDCYALKSYAMYPNVRESWEVNLGDVLDGIWDVPVINYLAKHNPAYFRIHVAGDFNITDNPIDNQAYLSEWYIIARQFPQTRFLAFTKQYQLDFWSMKPANVEVVFSGWPNLPMERIPGVQVAWMRDHTQPDPRIPSDAIECPGICESCGMCWSLGEIGRDVVFDKH